jgi:TonB family protein
MASPEKIAPLLPDTLPEDFSDWDCEASPASSTGDSGAWEAWQATHSNGKSPKPLLHAADRDAVLESLMEMPPASHSVPPAPAIAKQQKGFSEWDSELTPAPKLAAAPAAAPAPAALAPVPAPGPAAHNEWEAFGAPHTNGKLSKPLGQSSGHDAILPPVGDQPPVSDSAAAAPVVAKQQKSSTDWDSELSPAPRPTATPTPKSTATPASTPAPAPAPASRDEWEAFVEAPHSNGRPPKPVAESVDRDAVLESLVDRPRVSGSPSSATAAGKQNRDSIDWELEAPPKPSTTPAPAPVAGPAHVGRNEWEAFESPHTNGKPSKPLSQSSGNDAILPPVVDKPRVSVPASPVPASPKPQKYSSPLVEIMPGRVSHTPVASYPMSEVPTAASQLNAAAGVLTKPELAAPANHEAEVAHFPSFQSLDAEAEDEKNAAKKKWMIIAAVSVCGMLLVLMVISLVLQHGTKHAAKQSAQPAQALSDIQQDADTPAPAASDPSTQQKPPAAASEKQQATVPKAAKDDGGANEAPVQAQMMNDQLNAPTQIPQGIKKQVAETEPPPDSFGPAGAEGLGGSDASGSVFNGQAKPIVNRSRPVVISAGVAEGMLIQKSPPVYPSIARAARVSGTVVLDATISKTGTIRDLRVASGPAMLRSSAADAVRTWRYRPYKLNNEPVEVQATINVIFSLTN